MNFKMEVQLEVIYWEGRVDVIGWYNDFIFGKGRYVIVDWKVFFDIIMFWDKSLDVCG